MVVVAILAVVAGLIVPRMGQSVGRQQLAEAAARLAQTCRAARELAVASGRACAVEIDIDGNAYTVTQQSPTGSPEDWQPVGAVWLKGQKWPGSIKVEGCRMPDGVETAAGRVAVRFFADGRSNGLSIRLSADEQTYEVLVHPQTGRVVYGNAGDRVFAPDQYDLGEG